jgi:metal-responsive CopG/Arc/MetJ family transcriptional regulator
MYNENMFTFIYGLLDMKMVSVRLDAETINEFELVAKVKHQSKSELLKELVNKYIMEKRNSLYAQALDNIAKHEKENPDEYADIYDLRQDW